ncbi:MAG: hypothetical protein LBV12_10890 [Puniceicoccales bacterium]|jgi:hypothetical protein|nr:hypothetical protein [Puniceicoccales bacterium]
MILLRTPEDMEKSLTQIAKRRGQTRHGLILWILFDWLRANDQDRPA